MARALLIRQEEKLKIKKVMDFAENNRYDLAAMHKRMSDELDPPGAISDYTCTLPVDFKVVYSIEEQPSPLGWCRHISISIDKKGKVPQPHHVHMILEHFGFTAFVGEDELFIPEGQVFPDVVFGYKAINVVQRLDVSTTSCAPHEIQ